MPKDILNEREFELVNIVGAKLGSNQRQLSHQMNLSLGMINMLIRRLISKGYIRIKQLDKRKVDYILTPKGFAEKMRKSVKYTMKTLNSITLIKNRMREVIEDLHKNGERSFLIFGQSDLAVLVETTIKDIDGESTVSYVGEGSLNNGHSGTVLICTEEFDARKNTEQLKFVNLIEEIAKDDAFLVAVC